MTDQNFANNFWKNSHPRNIPAKLLQYLNSGFREELLRISSCLYSASSPYSPEPCLFDGSKFQEHFLKTVTLGKFVWKNFKIWQAVSENISYEFLHVRIVQVAFIRHSHVYWRIKIPPTNFEKGYPRNIPVKLFQNLTCSSREEFWRSA